MIVKRGTYLRFFRPSGAGSQGRPPFSQQLLVSGRRDSQERYESRKSLPFEMSSLALVACSSEMVFMNTTNIDYSATVPGVYHAVSRRRR